MISMTADDWKSVVAVMRQAPLNNMAHAEAVDRLCMKVLNHAGLVEEPIDPRKLPVSTGKPSTPTADFNP